MKSIINYTLFLILVIIVYSFKVPLSRKTPVSNHDTLVTAFLNPPGEAKPKVIWHWINGNISKEGITADLESMQRVGIGGVQLFSDVRVGTIVKGMVEFNTPEWWEMIRHTGAECERLGIELIVHNCAGWSQSGGPWITPEQSMQELTWSKTHVTGPVKFSGRLMQPSTKENYYKDISVYAYPLPTDEDSNHDKSGNSLLKKAKITCSNQAADCKLLFDDKNSTFANFNEATTEHPQYIQVEFEKPYAFRNVSLYIKSWKVPEGFLQVSDDGKIFRSIKKLQMDKHMVVGMSIPEVNARFYRFLFTGSNRPFEKVFSIAEIHLGIEWRVDQWNGKAGFGSPLIRETILGSIPDEAGIKRNQCINLTQKMSENGSLEWEVPSGNWLILRVGHTSNGAKNGPATKNGVGLECDKMNPSAVSTHFNAHMGKMAKEMGGKTGKTFKHIYFDSMEGHGANWTSDFIQEFIKRCGYDPSPCLPAITGQIVESEEFTNRFLWDFRRTIGDLIAENSYGTFKKLSNKLGLGVIAEAPGPGINTPYMVDAFQVKGMVSFPQGEFLVNRHAKEWALDCKETSSSAHITGKKWAFAEAFTARGDDSKWMNDPYDLKAIGDLHFCSGINQFVLHQFAHEPRKDKMPGMTLGPWGCQFNKNNTWWEQGAAWMKYLARCQYLLSQGISVGDIVYYVGEDVPSSLLWREVPAGYDYDGCGWDALSKMTVKNGRIFLPSGVSYQLLQLSEHRLLTPKVVRKLKELVEAGAVIIGPKPLKSPSLQGYPACDAEVKKLADELWGESNDSLITEHSFGKGKVYWGKTLATVLPEINLPPDFEFSSSLADAKLNYIHRRMDDTDIYFVSNQKDRAENVVCSFRIENKEPELWYPDNGKMVNSIIYNRKNNRTDIPLHLDPVGSVFVVFRHTGAKDPVVSVYPEATVSSNDKGNLEIVASQQGNYQLKRASGAIQNVSVASLPETVTISGKWDLAFPLLNKKMINTSFDSLTSWTSNQDPEIKYFSGTATYSKEIDIPAEMIGEGKLLYLDLGKVKNLAQVEINGTDIGVLWKPPFLADLTGKAKAGKNSIKIKITNLWPNRLIGDEQLPENERQTSTSYKHYFKDSPLLESGLIGPVQLVPLICLEIK
jgi:hypothetical protein